MSAATDLISIAQDVANYYLPNVMPALGESARSAFSGPHGLVVALGATFGAQKLVGLIGDAWQAGADAIATVGEVREGVRFAGVMLVRIVRKMGEIGRAEAVGYPGGVVASDSAESRNPRRRVIVVRVVRPRMAKVVAGRKIRRIA